MSETTISPLPTGRTDGLRRAVIDNWLIEQGLPQLDNLIGRMCECTSQSGNEQVMLITTITGVVGTVHWRDGLQIELHLAAPVFSFLGRLISVTPIPNMSRHDVPSDTINASLNLDDGHGTRLDPLPCTLNLL